MLTELKLSNFRIFDDEVTVRFRPITILIGRNSSGKSSIVKFLLMLQQSTMATRSEFPVVEGATVKLGPFPELKNSMTRKTSLGFELSLRAPFSDRTYSASSVLQQYNDASKSNLQLFVRGEVPYSDKASEGTIAYSLKQIDSAVIHAGFVTTFAKDYNFSMDATVRKLNEIQTAMDKIEDPENLDRQQARDLKALIGTYTEPASLGMVLRDELYSASYLPPVRTEPDRVVVTSNIPVDNVGTEGRYSVANLQRIKSEDQDAYRFVLRHLRNVAGIESVEFETDSSEVTQAFGMNNTTGAKVHIADYGFGVGQCLPILVQGAIMSPRTILMVEQPEAQLHPTAQLELGGFFADLWTQRQVGSIIETHSANILLRLRRLIARGELSDEDVSVAYFTFDEDKDNMPVVKNLDIKEDGSMEAGLPMEFFGADIIEGLQLGARV